MRTCVGAAPPGTASVRDFLDATLGGSSSVHRTFRECIPRHVRHGPKKLKAGPAAGPQCVSRGSPRGRSYFFAVTAIAVRSKMPYSKSITVSVMPFTHGLRRYLVAE